MTDHNLPWVYRPREFDDWGWIRDASGDLAACARGEKGGKTHDEHRVAKTDPYGDYAALIVKAVNSHDALVDILKIFLGHDERFQIAVGGNPLAVEKMLAAAKRTLVRVSAPPEPK